MNGPPVSAGQHSSNDLSEHFTAAIHTYLSCVSDTCEPVEMLLKDLAAALLYIVAFSVRGVKYEAVGGFRGCRHEGK